MYSLLELQCPNTDMFNLIKAILNKYDQHQKEQQHQDDGKNLTEFLLENLNLFHHLPEDIENLACIQKQLDDDYNHYEQMKSSRMKEIIERIRKHFANLSAKCMIDFENLVQSNDHYRQLFQKSDDYNAELLEAHESELSRLKRYYNEYEKFFTLIAQCHRLQEEIVECEQQSRNVYTTKNRGGIMLQILNKQRTTQKRLLHAQEQIRKWYNEYYYHREDNLTIPFDYYGVRIEDIINIT
ncbi:hypothetical protein BLA29_005123 [Euroglyphus maynei]|uniref:Uncharacterized protein n=1 Tax=Euroglyphus maynei TaxID=6958 RepID=A0A1Y3AU45_EURMA|nr:hypothetical protein BLA29_005123 [Euroglyphus maynei]